MPKYGCYDHHAGQSLIRLSNAKSRRIDRLFGLNKESVAREWILAIERITSTWPQSSPISAGSTRPHWVFYDVCVFSLIRTEMKVDPSPLADGWIC